MPSLSPDQFTGPYENWDTDHAFAKTRRYDSSLADAPPFPAGIEGRWTTEKGNALDQAKVEWRSSFGSRTPDGGVHPNAVQRLRTGTNLPFDPEHVKRGMDVKVDEVDPRTLHGIQPGVHKAGVEYYLTDNYAKTGETFEQRKGNAPTVANRYPTVYQREDGMNVLLSGHHRAAAALSMGKPLVARTMPGPVPDRGKR